MMTSDSGYILGGTSNSLDGDVSNNHGLEDFWVVNLDKNLNLEWETCLGSTSVDGGCNIKETQDNGYLATGGIHRNDGDVNCNYHEDYDAWVVKLDSTGNIQWQNCYGGSLSDGFNDFVLTVDGGYLLAGGTGSYDGDVTGNHGDNDVWVVKIDSIGNLEWQKCYGGMYYETSSFIIPSMDGNYYIGSVTTSNNGDVSGNHSPAGGVVGDAWLIKISPSGDLLWQQCIGGFLEDYFDDLLEVEPGKLILVGGTRSLDGSGDVMCGKHGYYDVWLVCATDLTTSMSDVKKGEKCSVITTPNPASESVTFTFKGLLASENVYLGIYTITGETVHSINLSPAVGQYQWQTTNVRSGMYFYTLHNGKDSISGKIAVIK
ncbi:MAG: T9SS type A sorting domain-containing protein [Bacteroidetes bacterium]|nr:T9SS type A sorting domain-containing protein [Bacteroidota bacterium]